MKTLTSIEVSMSNEKQKLLNIALDGLDEKYPSGLYEWLFNSKIETYRHIFKLEDSINNNFINSESLEELKSILRKYWIEHIKAIGDFKQAEQSDVSLDEVRLKRIEALETEHVP